MKTEMVKCSSAACGGRSFYPNQMTPVETSRVEFELCPDCIRVVNNTLGNKATVGLIIKTTMTMAEVLRIRDERIGDVVGWPHGLITA